MHIGLKKIKYELIRLLSKGSEEQIEEIYNIAKEEFLKTSKGLLEKNIKNNSLGAVEIPRETNEVKIKKMGRPKKIKEITE
jgi:hypothetical protein